MASETARQRLIRFLDERAFDPILRASSAEDSSEADRRALEDVQRRTEIEKSRYHEQYGSAEEIRARFLDDVSSPAAEKVNAELKRLGLPRLPDLKDEFLRLCERVGVARGA